MVFWVVGGEYSSTEFRTLAPGKLLETHGPYPTYQEAYAIWAARAWATVDDAHMRFRVVEGDEREPGNGPSLAEGQPVKA